MADAPIVIRCPFCRHPYPMSPTQISVYRGRHMGCMNCGKPFEVREPAPPPALPSVVSAVDVTQALAAGAAAVGDAAAGDATTLRPAALTSATLESVAAPSGSGDRPAAAAPWREQGAGWQRIVATSGLVAAFACPVLVAAAIVAGYSESTAEIPRAADTAVTIAFLRSALFAALFAALAGAVVLTTRRRLSSGDQPRNTRAWTGLGVGGLQLVVILIIASTAWPALNRSLADRHRAACQTQLQDLGRLLIAQAQADREGKFASSLGEPVRANDLLPNALICPASHDERAAASLSTFAVASQIDSGEHTSYVYLGKGLALRGGSGTQATTQTILAYEAPGHHDPASGVHLLFADGVVLFAEGESATSVVAELRSGTNPPPTAAMLRR